MSARPRILALSFACVTAAAPLAAQDAKAPFLERSYFAPGTPSGKKLAFEGTAVGHYFFYNTLDDLVWQKQGGTKLVWPVTMMFVVRMSTDFSSPVRTPSYQIRPLYAQVLHLWRPSGDKHRYHILEGAVGLTHYSNGQSGCTYLGEGVNTAGDGCEVKDATLYAKRFTNVENGNFSTDFIPIVLHYRRGHLLKPLAMMDHQQTVGVELQLHPIGHWMPGALDLQQANQYGMHQYSVTAELERRRARIPPIRFEGVFRVAAKYTERFGGGAPAHLRNGFGEVSYVFDRVEHWGVFARYHAGFDYYNIQWQDTHSFLSLGFVWDRGRMDTLETDP
ncbi:MAG TPA: hypothetical protein VHM30_01310 [Gemmatimonadaceae bacterium]|nr:hypothetical protein [Gemmatimonadaceae bacterium]